MKNGDKMAHNVHPVFFPPSDQKKRVFFSAFCVYFPSKVK